MPTQSGNTDFAVVLKVNGTAVGTIRLNDGDELPKELEFTYSAGDKITATIDYDDDNDSTQAEDYEAKLSANGSLIWTKADLSGLTEGGLLEAEHDTTGATQGAEVLFTIVNTASWLEMDGSNFPSPSSLSDFPFTVTNSNVNGDIVAQDSTGAFRYDAQGNRVNMADGIIAYMGNADAGAVYDGSIIVYELDETSAGELFQFRFETATHNVTYSTHTEKYAPANYYYDYNADHTKPPKYLAAQWWADGHDKPAPPVLVGDTVYRADDSAVTTDHPGKYVAMYLGTSIISENSRADGSDACNDSSPTLPYVYDISASSSGDVVKTLKASDVGQTAFDDGFNIAFWAWVAAPPYSWGGKFKVFVVEPDGTPTAIQTWTGLGADSSDTFTDCLEAPAQQSNGLGKYSFPDSPHDSRANPWANQGDVVCWWQTPNSIDCFTSADHRLALQWWRDGEAEPATPTFSAI